MKTRKQDEKKGSQGVLVAKEYLLNKRYAVEHVTDSTPQRECGDLIVVKKKNGSTPFYVEVKTEDWPYRYTGNFFLEEYSNRKKDVLGWMHYLTNAKFLFYLFLPDDCTQYDIYKIEYKPLQEWYMKNKGYYTLVKGKRTKQSNDTWGYLVPKKDVSVFTTAEETDVIRRPR